MDEGERDGGNDDSEARLLLPPLPLPPFVVVPLLFAPPLPPPGPAVVRDARVSCAACRALRDAMSRHRGIRYAEMLPLPFRLAGWLASGSGPETATSRLYPRRPVGQTVVSSKGQGPGSGVSCRRSPSTAQHSTGEEGSGDVRSYP